MHKNYCQRCEINPWTHNVQKLWVDWGRCSNWMNYEDHNFPEIIEDQDVDGEDNLFLCDDCFKKEFGG